MDHCTNSCSKSKNRKQNKSNAWVRRSTRGSKDFGLYLDEDSVQNADEDITSHCHPELKDKTESREMFESVGDDGMEHSSSAIKTDNDLNNDSGSSSIPKNVENLENDIKGKKRGRTRKYIQPREEVDDTSFGSKKRKNGKPRKMVHIHCEEEGDYLVDTETEKRESSTKAGERQEEPFDLPKDIAKGKGRKAGEEVQREEEIGDLQPDTAKKKRKKPRKTNQEEQMESGNAMVTEKKNAKIRKLKKNVQTKEKTADVSRQKEQKLLQNNFCVMCIMLIIHRLLQSLQAPPLPS